MKKGTIALFALLTFISCGNNATTQSSESSESSCCSTESKSIESNTVEVLYMHGKQRCATCIAIGTETEAVIKELANDNIVMRTIDFSTHEGEKIADKYEITSSSLIVVKGDKVDNLTTVGFMHARNNPEEFRNSLKESIEKIME